MVEYRCEPAPTAVAYNIARVTHARAMRRAGIALYISTPPSQFGPAKTQENTVMQGHGSSHDDSSPLSTGVG